MTPFDVYARCRCPVHADVAFALAAEFRPIRRGAAEAALDELAGCLSGVTQDPPADQLAHIGSLLAGAFTPVELEVAIDDLLLDRVVLDRAGHPLALAVAGAEVARRAGLPVGLVGGAAGVFLASTRAREAIGVDAEDGEVVDLTALEGQLRWQCAHQIAVRLLNRIADRTARTGHVVDALRAAQLRLRLPVDAETRAQLEGELARVRARLN